ncbi:ModD protein [Zavarzinia aquatilis]|uniref:Putative pyrophosphorylase ModD n=1 Tax=Zavarzinia aquatilis TaxID=2211142 RepID=A0A317EFY2_9PROT|nr:ModD protein [Zavarzinia aquatilis]PWR25206.1 ModD protein [Zavarzinia aquatilis]
MPIADAELDRLIAEDVPFGDLTTEALGLGDCLARITFAARTPLVACCTEEAARLLTRLGAAIEGPILASGTMAPPGTPLLAATGPAEAVFAGWKIAQTLVEWASGIATATRELVDAARIVAPGIQIACTRKTVPLTRAFSAKAVKAGGGILHRVGLSETVLVFPEHRALLGGEAPAAILARLRQSAPERALVIEVTTVDDALAVAEAADVIQLEKFAPAEVARTVAGIEKRADRRPIIAAAGGIGPGNVAAYAASGADVLVTSAPYTSRPAEVQVRISAIHSLD